MASFRFGAIRGGRISATSKQYVYVPVSMKTAGAYGDPTVDVVSFAFLPGAGPPQTADWQNGSWETDATLAPPTYYARCLVGTGGVVLAAGTYNVWLRLTDNPEIPIAPVGRLVIY